MKGAPNLTRLILRILSLTLFLASSGLLTHPSSAKPRIYQLESFEVRGTERISVETLIDELELYPGTKLNDALVMTIREKILGLGLFKSVLLYMRKGQTPGTARLIIEAEDDDSVLGSWAIGTEIAVTSGEPRPSTLTPGSPSLGYRMDLVARNLYGLRHRGSVSADVDSRSVLRAGHLAYGWPRFSQESVQFDGQLKVVDVSHRYLDAEGFGARGDAHWTYEEGEKSIQYGVAMYLNRPGRFAMPGYPETVAGPKFGMSQETRLLGFVPQQGYGYRASILIPPPDYNFTILEATGEVTEHFGGFVGTLSAKFLTVGSKGLMLRLTSNLEYPFGSGDGDDAKAYVKIRAGSDHYEKTKLSGSSMTLGIRYHSTGFIAEFALKITQVPKDFEPLLYMEGAKP